MREREGEKEKRERGRKFDELHTQRMRMRENLGRE